MAMLCCLVLLLSIVPSAHAAGITWHVNRPGDDPTNGDLRTHSGSLRFALTNAVSGDVVQFGDFGADTIFVHSTLVVPAGVSVGGARNQADCEDYHTPRANIKNWSAFHVETSVQPGRGRVAAWHQHRRRRYQCEDHGDDVDICGVGIGIVHDGDGYVISLPPAHAALIIDGARAVARNYLNGAVVVSSHSGDTRIGDTIDGSGDANDGVRDAWVSVLTNSRDIGGPCANSTNAAQRVTIRNRFPRKLACLRRSLVCWVATISPPCEQLGPDADDLQRAHRRRRDSAD